MAGEKQLVVSRAQLEIMELVWERGEVTVAEVWEAMRERRPIARNTVQTTMKRLEDKGWLRHREEGKTYIYTSAKARQGIRERFVSLLVDVAFQGAADGLVMALLDGRGVSDEEADRIRALIEKQTRGTDQ